MPRTLTRILKGREVWKTITPLVEESRRTLAAIAYLGKDGGDLLPLKAGDTLVVDMSLGAVKQGVTDPREVKKYIDRGVYVASRSDLHAKMIVAGEWLVTGSMNASWNSANVLAEAAVLTNARGAAKAARKTIERWALSPVLPLQLETALEKYRPPVFKAAKPIRRRKKAPRQVSQAPRLWIIGNLSWGDVPESEREKARQHVEVAVRGVRRRPGTNRNSIQLANKARFFSEVRPADWVITVTENKVDAPGFVAAKTSYPRGKGKRRYLVIVEEREAPMTTWRAFKRAVHMAAGLKLNSQRHRCFSDVNVVEDILGCWSRKTWKPRKQYFGSSTA